MNPWLIGLGVFALVKIFLGDKELPGSLPVATKRKVKGMEKVTRWLPQTQAAHARYPKIAVSLGLAIIENESGGNPGAIRWECKDPKTGKLFGGPKPCNPASQRKDAKGRPIMSTGLVQFLIATGEKYGLRSTIDPATDERRDPDKNIMAAFHFLSDLKATFPGDEDAAIAAYNAGAGGVKNYKKKHGGVGVPNPAYVQHVRAKQEKYRVFDQTIRGEANGETSSGPLTPNE